MEKLTKILYLNFLSYSILHTFIETIIFKYNSDLHIGISIGVTSGYYKSFAHHKPNNPINWKINGSLKENIIKLINCIVIRQDIHNFIIASTLTHDLV